MKELAKAIQTFDELWCKWRRSLGGMRVGDVYPNKDIQRAKGEIIKGFYAAERDNQAIAKKFADMETRAHFLEDRIREYLEYGSTDGKIVRQELRAELKKLVEKK